MLKHAYHTFDNTGWPAPCLTHYDANSSGGTALVKVVGKHIVVLGISSEQYSLLREDSTGSNTTGTVRAQIPGDSDGLVFPGAVDMGYEMGVYVESPSGSDITVWYYLKDENIV